MPHRKTIRPRFEPLERRDLLAWWSEGQQINGPPGGGGDVTVAVESGTLVVRGDAGPNGVQIYHLGNGWYRLNSSNGTTLNGQSTEYGPAFQWNGAEFFGAVNGVQVELGDGDDSVSVFGDGISELVIDAGAGDDSAHVNGVVNYWPIGMADTDTIKPLSRPATLGRVRAAMGDGDDLFGIFADVAGDAIVRMGAGEDQFAAEGSYEDPYYGEITTYLRAGGQRVIDLGNDQTPAPVLSRTPRSESTTVVIGPLRLEDVKAVGPTPVEDISISDPLVFISLLDAHYGRKTGRHEHA